jgi:transcriptional regulator with XRE-family HTH domain
MSEHHLQSILFSRVKALLPSNISIAEYLADLLLISKDSVYRRLKGEKQLSFNELAKVATAFNISLDELFNLGEGNVIFHGQFVNSANFRLESYLGSMLENVDLITRYDDKELFYICKDIPIFYYLMFPEIAAFKFFIWTKTQMQFEEMKNNKFSFNILTPALQELCQKISSSYVQIPGTEILNADNILNDLRQLDYYRDTGMFENKEDLALLYNKLAEMVAHMELQAAAGQKFLPGKSPEPGAGVIKVYVNDFFVGDNTIIATINGSRIVYLNHTAINFISTASREFADYNYDFIQNIIKKSALISVVGERDRKKFFNLILDRIDEFKMAGIQSVSN